MPRISRTTGPISLLLGGILVAITTPGCSREAAQAATARPAIAVEVAPAAPGDLEETIAVVGTLAPKFEGEVKAEYSGVVREVLVSEWVPVRKGMVLARLDSREEEAAVKAATAARLQAEVAVARARREHERTVQLEASGLATRQSLEDVITALDAAAAQLAAAKAQEEMARTRLEKTAIRATTDGVIGERNVNPGDFVENMGSPQPMFRIVDNRTLELTVSVPSSRIASVALGQPLRFTTDALPGRGFEAHVRFINPAADPVSRTVRVHAAIDNRDAALKAGLFVKGFLVTGSRNGVLRIPRSALVTWDPASARGLVFTVRDDKAEPRPVETGVISGDSIEVTRGLSAGEPVVSRGAFNLREGDRVSVTSAPGA